MIYLAQKNYKYLAERFERLRDKGSCSSYSSDKQDIDQIVYIALKTISFKLNTDNKFCNRFIKENP